jgi:predicted Fe-S protein YdhL (DUF1289 family)
VLRSPLPDPDDVVLSPCVRVCVLDPATGLCRGCARTLEEIAGWPSMTSAERRDVLRRLAERG